MSIYNSIVDPFKSLYDSVLFVYEARTAPAVIIL